MSLDLTNLRRTFRNVSNGNRFTCPCSNRMNLRALSNITPITSLFTVQRLTFSKLITHLPKEMEVECADIAFVFCFWPGEARAAAYCNTIMFIWLPWQLTDERWPWSSWTRTKKTPPLSGGRAVVVHCTFSHVTATPGFLFPSLLPFVVLFLIVVAHCLSSILPPPPLAVSQLPTSPYSSCSPSSWEVVLPHRPFSSTTATPGCLPINPGSLTHHLHFHIITRSRWKERKAVYWILLHP